VKKLFIIFLFLILPAVSFSASCDGTALTGLTEDTAPTADDLFYSVNDPDGTPADRKVTLDTILRPTIQVTDPTSSDDSGLYINSVDGDAFLVSKNIGISTWATTYTPSEVTCSGVFSSGDNESCESVVDGDMCTTDWDTVVDTNSILTTNSTDWANTGLKSIEVAMSAISQVAYVPVDIGAQDGDWSVRFYIHTPVSYSGQAIKLMTANEAALPNSERVSIDFREVGIRADSSTASSYIAVSDDTTYRVELDYNRNSTGTITVYNTSDVQVGSESFTCNDSDTQYMGFGQISTSTGDFDTFYIDDIKYQAGGGYIGPQ
jgi:hypothetical protein